MIWQFVEKYFFTPLKVQLSNECLQIACFLPRNKKLTKPVPKVYRKLASKTDPRISFRIPQDVHTDIVAHAESNARTKADEIIARLIATLLHNDEFMAHDRLMRLIYSKKLAHKGDGNNKA